MARKIVAETITILLIVLWIYTGVSKIMDYTNFKFNLGRSPFIQSFAGIIAILLPVGELILALILIIKKTRLLGLYLSLFLLFLFTGYIYIMLEFSYDLPCSCGGVLSTLSWRDHLFFNATYIVLSIIGIYTQSKEKPLFPHSEISVLKEK